MRWCRVGAALLVAALLGAGCGARLSKSQLAAANANGAAGAGSGAAGAGAGAAAGAASGSGAGSSGAGAASGATGAAGASGSSTAGGASAAQAAPAPAGGNGGATDVGVTATTITLGNVSTLTGVVPGLFQGAIDGVQAFFAYQNSQGGVYGRKLQLTVADDHLDESENRNQTQALSSKVFAFVGSFSVFDEGGADPLRSSGVPDVGYALSTARANLPNNFSPQPLPIGWRSGPLNYFKQHYPDAIGHVGALVVNAASPKQTWVGEKAVMLRSGYSIAYERTFEATETDFTADIVQMKAKGVKMVVMAADVGNMARVAKTMLQQGFKVPLPNFGANAYDPKFITNAGADAAEGALLDQQLSLYAGEDRAAIPEVDLFLTWLNRVHPGMQADIYSAFSWASARLFVQALIAGGPKATRAGLLAQLKKIDNFDDNGMLAPAGPASKRPPDCYILVRVHNGKFQREDSPAPGYRCNDGPYIKTG